VPHIYMQHAAQVRAVYLATTLGLSNAQLACIKAAVKHMFFTYSPSFTPQK